MTPQFRLTEPAIRDIEQIVDYIARKSGWAQADRFLTRLDAKFSNDNATKSYLGYVAFQWLSTSFSIYQQIRT